jgi:periplasmic protein CpxP/Spy
MAALLFQWQRLMAGRVQLFPLAGVCLYDNSHNPMSSMKSTLRLSLATVMFGLSAACFLRADDQPDSTPPPSATTPPAGEKPHHGGRMSPEKMLQMLSDRLSLTDDQKAKILPLLQAQSDQIKALHEDSSLSDDDKRDKGRDIMKSTHEQIRALLTPEQQEEFDHMRGSGGRNGPPPSANNPPPAPPSQSE